MITGAGSGIGKVTALQFANSGYRVFVGDLRFDDQTRSLFASAGIGFQDCDVRRVADIGRLVDFAVEQTSRLDVLINNAGVGMVKQIDEVTEDDWHNVVDVNVKAAFFGCQAAIRHMRLRDNGGAIVNVASNAGLLPRAHDPVYSISKLAVVGLTRSLALCHSKDRVRINCVCPGPVERTEMIEENFVGRIDRQQVVRELIHASPLARAWDRMVQPEEVADAILYLAGDGARMVTGTAIAIDGGTSLAVPPVA